MKEKILNILKAELASNQDQLAAHNELKEILRPFEGKYYDGRLQKKLPEGYKIERSGNHAFASIYIQTPKHKHFVAYVENPVINIAEFDEGDAPYCRGAKDRIKKLEAILNDPERLAQCIATFAKLAKAWKAFSEAAKAIENNDLGAYPNPAYYDLLRECNVDSKIILHYL